MSNVEIARDTAREAILTVLEPLRAKHAEDKKQLAADAVLIRQLESALKPLRPGKQANGKASNKENDKFAKKTDVEAVYVALVKANQPIAKADLQSLANHKLSSELEFSLRNVPRLGGLCLDSDAFVIDENDMVSLSSSEATQNGNGKPQASLAAN